MDLKKTTSKHSLRKRPLISLEEASGLMNMFKIFSNDTRLRLLHALARCDELCVSALSEKVGMKPQAVSNQLQRLLDQNILASRRNGNEIYYRIADTCVFRLLEYGLCLVRDSKNLRFKERKTRTA